MEIKDAINLLEDNGYTVLSPEETKNLFKRINRIDKMNKEFSMAESIEEYKKLLDKYHSTIEEWFFINLSLITSSNSSILLSLDIKSFSNSIIFYLIYLFLIFVIKLHYFVLKM